MANHTHEPSDIPAVHGMLLFGTGPIYVSHLPMFMTPHDHQLIAEVEFSGADNPQDTYVKDRAKSGEKIYTWVPKRFVLPELLDFSKGQPSMQGTIFRGHFERGGTAITGGTVKSVVRTLIHAHRLSLSGPRDPKLRYVVFGSSPSMFAAHLVSGPPDFDQVVAVELSARPTAKNPDVVVEGRKNDPEHCVRPGEQVSVTGSGAQGLTMKCLDEVYLEIGELSGA